MKFDTKFCGDRLFGAADRASAQHICHRPRRKTASSLKSPKRPELYAEFGSNFLRVKNVTHSVHAFGQFVHDRGR